MARDGGYYGGHSGRYGEYNDCMKDISIATSKAVGVSNII